MLNSIRLRLFIWLLVIFSIILTGLGSFLYYELKEFAINQVDGKLMATLQTISSIMLIEDSHGQLEMELWELAHVSIGEFSERLSGHYYQIVSPDGKILSRSPSLGLADAHMPVVTRSEKLALKTLTGPSNIPLRLVYQSFKFQSGILTVEVGDSLDDTYTLLKSFRNTLMVILPSIFVLSGLGALIITGRALTPIKAFSSNIGQITEENLDVRIEEIEVASELKQLATSFNKMLGRIEGAFTRQRQFLSDASHELRTPTSIIKSYCDVTLNRQRTADEYRGALIKIGDTVNRMCDIINRILVISRLDSKTLGIKPVRMDLMEVMKDILRLVEPAATSREINLKLEGRGVNVRGDREGLSEVFTNIVENAIKYNKIGGSVDIHVGESADMGVITVKDSGIGIPSEEIPKIFDRFYRVDTSRGQTVGSGLGLSIVKAIVEAHGGKIEVESAVGKGSTFKVFLPKEFDSKSVSPPSS